MNSLIKPLICYKKLSSQTCFQGISSKRVLLTYGTRTQTFNMCVYAVILVYNLS